MSAIVTKSSYGHASVAEAMEHGKRCGGSTEKSKRRGSVKPAPSPTMALVLENSAARSLGPHQNELAAVRMGLCDDQVSAAVREGIRSYAVSAHAAAVWSYGQDLIPIRLRKHLSIGDISLLARAHQISSVDVCINAASTKAHVVPQPVSSCSGSCGPR